MCKLIEGSDVVRRDEIAVISTQLAPPGALKIFIFYRKPPSVASDENRTKPTTLPLRWLLYSLKNINLQWRSVVVGDIEAQSNIHSTNIVPGTYSPGSYAIFFMAGYQYKDLVLKVRGLRHVKFKTVFRVS